MPAAERQPGGLIELDPYLLSLEVVHESVVLHLGPTQLPRLTQLCRLQAKNMSAADRRVT